MTARLNPIDVDQVYPGQDATLRFSAFPARVTPEFDGHVVRVSPDAVHDAQTGVSWYEVELALDQPDG
uniref:HlyD family secretion protein n=1 Tax=Methylobacterium crusticola TaxID=1697972 RepID=UPI001EE1E6F9